MKYLHQAVSGDGARNDTTGAQVLYPNLIALAAIGHRLPAHRHLQSADVRNDCDGLPATHQFLALEDPGMKGLAAADGVMEWLEEEGEGFDTGVARVPIVPAAVIFDLAPNVARPGREEGRRAAELASSNPVPEGRVGAGAGE